jgi:H+/Cl- antiporter ClcA
MNVKANSIRFWMLIVEACAVFFRLPKLLVFPIPAAPVRAVLSYFRFEGNPFLGGMLAGVICGVAATFTFGIAMYIDKYFEADPNTVDYLGPALSFLLLGFVGAIFGASVGLIVVSIRKLEEVVSRKRKQWKPDRRKSSRLDQ